MTSLPKCLGNICSALHKLVIEKIDATHYSLDKPSSSSIKLKKAAFRKFEIGKSRYEEAMREAFEREAKKAFQFAFGKDGKGMEKILRLKSCGDNVCECVASEPAKGSSIVINFNCLYRTAGQSFIIYGSVKYRLDTIISVCNLKKEALFEDVVFFNTEVAGERLDNLTTSGDLLKNGIQQINQGE